MKSVHPDSGAVMKYLASMQTDVRGIAQALGIRVERVTGAIVVLEAHGMVEYIAGDWRLTAEAERTLA